MKIKNVILVFVLLALVSSCVKDKQDKRAILCGTSMIASLVRDLAPETARVTLVPAMACPGTYDLKPEDAKAIATAKLIIIHPYQSYLAEKLARLNKKNVVEKLDAVNLNTPADYMSGLMNTQEILLKIYPQRSSEFSNRRQLIFRQAQEKLAGDMMWRGELSRKKIRVLCSVLQVNFAKYAGFEVTGTFASPDGLTPDKLKEVIKTAKKGNVKYIISNLTGDNDMTADIINNQLKLKKIVLSSFPAEEGAGSWFFNIYDYNMARIKEALEVN